MAQDVLGGVSKQLLRRGYFTTEWWTTIIGGALSAVLALVHVNGSSATHVAAVIAPAILAGLYAITRTMHKSALASALADAFPQATQTSGQGEQSAPAAQSVVLATAPPAAAQPAASAAMASAPVASAPASAPTATAPTGTAPGAEGAAIAQTDPDFEFRGIPPIEDTDG